MHMFDSRFELKGCVAQAQGRYCMREAGSSWLALAVLGALACSDDPSWLSLVPEKW